MKAAPALLHPATSGTPMHSQQFLPLPETLINTRTVSLAQLRTVRVRLEGIVMSVWVTKLFMTCLDLLQTMISEPKGPSVFKIRF